MPWKSSAQGRSRSRRRFLPAAGVRLLGSVRAGPAGGGPVPGRPRSSRRRVLPPPLSQGPERSREQAGRPRATRGLHSSPTGAHSQVVSQVTRVQTRLGLPAPPWPVPARTVRTLAAAPPRRGALPSCRQGPALRQRPEASGLTPGKAGAPARPCAAGRPASVHQSTWRCEKLYY